MFVDLRVASRRHSPDKSLQFLKIDRFGQVMIETGIHAAPDILFHAETTERDTHQRLPRLGRAHDVATIAVRQSDVANQSIKTLVFEKFNRGLDTLGSEHLVALLSQK